jgi:hypothetical protein
VVYPGPPGTTLGYAPRAGQLPALDDASFTPVARLGEHFRASGTTRKIN